MLAPLRGEGVWAAGLTVLGPEEAAVLAGKKSRAQRPTAGDGEGTRRAIWWGDGRLCRWAPCGLTSPWLRTDPNLEVGGCRVLAGLGWYEAERAFVFLGVVQSQDGVEAVEQPT